MHYTWFLMWRISRHLTVGLLLQGYILMALGFSKVSGLIYILYVGNETKILPASFCVGTEKIGHWQLPATTQFFIPLIRAHARGYYEQRQRIIFFFDLSQLGVVRSKERFLEVVFVERTLVLQNSVFSIRNDPCNGKSDACYLRTSFR